MKMEAEGKMCADIPMDVLVDILSRVPAKCVWRFRSVCKDWKSLIEAPSFADLHLRLSKERYSMGWGRNNDRISLYSIDKHDGKANEEFVHPPMTITSSIDGLICYMGADGFIKVSNLVTNELITLPKPTFFSSLVRSEEDVVGRFNEMIFSLHTNIKIEIGFDPTAKRYKVLAMRDRLEANGRHQLEVEIFALGGTRTTMRWRKVDASFAYNFFDSMYANGFWYLLTTLFDEDDGEKKRSLLAFSFAEEKFEFVPLPPNLDDDDNATIHYSMHQVEVGGCLCLLESKFDSELKRTVKLRKLVNSNTHAWVDQHIAMPPYDEFSFMLPISSGVMLVRAYYRSYYFKDYICSYNEEGQIVKTVQVHDMPEGFFPEQLHFESLVSLRSILAAEES